MTQATIVQLYPDELGVAGDRGNLLALASRLTAAGIAHEVVEYRRGDAFPERVDAVVIGSGPLSAMRNVHDDLFAHADKLREWADAGVPIFAFASGAELLSLGTTLTDGTKLDGVGIFPFHAVRTTNRKVGYVLVSTSFGQLVGFEDNASDWKLEPGATPLGTVTIGGGNGGGSEGVTVGASIATQVGGPALPLNPKLTDVIVASIAARVGAEVQTAPAGDLDDYARRAREVIIANAKHVFSRI